MLRVARFPFQARLRNKINKVQGGIEQNVARIHPNTPNIPNSPNSPNLPEAIRLTGSRVLATRFPLGTFNTIKIPSLEVIGSVTDEDTLSHLNV